MNAPTATALVAMGREFVVSREVDLTPGPSMLGADHDAGWSATATAVFSLIVDPLSILGFPGRLSGGMAIPNGQAPAMR